jgi:hypothetical protein
MNKKYPEMRQLIAKVSTTSGYRLLEAEDGQRGENGADKDIHPAETL